MISDPFPVDQNRIIKDLERRIEALEAQVRARPGTPITQASGPFYIPNSSTPDTPTGGVRLYAAGGGFRVIEDDGTVREIGDPFTPASNVIVDSITAPTAPGTYNSTWGQQIRNDLVSVNNGLVELIVNMRAVDMLV